MNLVTWIHIKQKGNKDFTKLSSEIHKCTMGHPTNAQNKLQNNRTVEVHIFNLSI